MGSHRLAAFTYANDALLIGDEWVLLTFGFEVLAYVLIGTSWHRLLMEYNVTQGLQWELVLTTMLVAPAVTAIRQHLVSRHQLVHRRSRRERR